jgi:SPW repeat
MKRRLAKLELTATGALLVTGAWLAASPLLVGYTRLQVASWLNALAGLAVVVLAVLQHTRPARRPLTGAVLVGLGIWLLVAPVLLGYGSWLVRDSEPGQATWNGAFAAAVVLAATAVHASAARRSGRTRKDVTASP